MIRLGESCSSPKFVRWSYDCCCIPTTGCAIGGFLALLYPFDACGSSLFLILYMEALPFSIEHVVDGAEKETRSKSSLHFLVIIMAIVCIAIYVPVQFTLEEIEAI